MLEIVLADGLTPLADHLTGVLSDPADDPMAPEWVAVPSEGIRRWLELHLARTLGNTGPGHTDGIATNFDLPFPGTLRRRAVEAMAGFSSTTDPWQPELTVWRLLDILDQNQGDPQLGPLATRPEHGSFYARVRRIAELFDRYSVHRPEMLREWNRHSDLGADGNQIDTNHRWQPHLWRLLTQAIPEVADPAERFHQALQALRTGELDLGLPHRLSFFGLTVLPAGSSFLALLDAVSTNHEVRLFIPTPSVPLAQSILDASRLVNVNDAVAQRRSMTRTANRFSELVAHDLVESWGTRSLETTALLSRLETTTAVTPASRGEDHGTTTLLQALQHDIRSGDAAAGRCEPAGFDNSVQVHSCPGNRRQVEVLHDAILHLLADDPTLSEEDIVVLCPKLEVFAPLIRAGFGRSASAGSAPDPANPTRLRYRISARELATVDPVSDALDAFLHLADGRFPASEVLDFAALGPVRRRFGFTDDDIATLADWIDRTNTRWGLDGRHRTRWDLPASFTANSWRAAADALLMGIAVRPDPTSGSTDMAVGDVAPAASDGDIDLVGRFAELVETFEQITGQVAGRHTAPVWADVLEAVVDGLFAVDQEDLWQHERVLRGIGELALQGHGSSTLLSIADVRSCLGALVAGDPGRSSLFGGGITVTSMFPLQWVPHRVVCLLGLDDDALARSNADGDDLLVIDPQLGDTDPRSEQRNALLQAVCTAGANLVITRNGLDLRTSHEIPAPVAVAELRDTLSATLTEPARSQRLPTDTAPPTPTPANRGARVEFTHPLHGFDASNFSSSASSARPWGFDPHMAGAAAARSARNPAAPVTGLLHEPLPKLPLHRVELSQLHRFLNDPQGTFLRTRFDVAIPREQELPPDQLPAELDGLDKWKIGNDLLNAELAGTAEGFDERAVLRGAVPPADLGRTVLNEKRGEVDLLTDELTRLGINYGTTSRHAVAVETGSSLISGAVDVHESGAGAGPVRVLFSARKPKHLLDIWLDLLVLTVAIPERTWVATLLNKAKAKASGPQRTLDRLVVHGDPGETAEIARQALSRVLELYELGMSEPLPLFPATSHAALAGPDHNDVLKAWEGNMFMPGERTKPAGQLAVGSVDLSDLFKAPPRPTDPAGPGESRVERYAHLLWDAYEDSVTNHDGDDA